MKVKEEYILQNIAGRWVIVDTNSQSVNFNNILALNDTGKFLWEKLEEGSDEETLTAALMQEFEINKDLAEKDVKKFVLKLQELECLDDEK